MPRTKVKSRRGPSGHDNREKKEAERQVKRQREGPALGKDEAESSLPPAKKPKPNPFHDPSQDQSAETAAAAPPSNLSSTPAIPINLQSTHQVTSVRIITASKIRKKVAHVLELLPATSTTPLEKPRVALLYAKAEAASKAVSIAEIAKREMAQDGGRWFQYTQVESTLEIQGDKKLKKKGKKGKEVADAEATGSVDEDEDMDEAFETMKTPFERAIEGKEKVRAIPIMSIYLSRVSIESLKRSFGEQSNV